MKCNNSECMKNVLKNKAKFNGAVYCKNGKCVYAGAGLGNDSYMSFTLKHTGSGSRIKSSLLPIRDKFHEAQADLDEWADEKNFSECIVNVILRKEAINERQESYAEAEKTAL